MAKAPLLETPGSMEEVSLLSEVIQTKRQELSQLKHDLETVRAKLTSERVQWSQQKDSEEAEWRNRRQELEESYQTKIAQVDEDVRQASLSLENQRSLERASEQLVLEHQQRLEIRRNDRKYWLRERMKLGENLIKRIEK